jgi:endonuclease/exonuclease/phosphatase family metal-dependent hydrolase
MWNRVSLVAVMGWGLGVAAVVAEPVDLGVMSFNIRYGTADDGENRWDRRREQVVDVLREEGPDVVGLQEALRFQLDEMRSALPGYGELGQGRDGGTAGEYSAIFYRVDRLRVEKAGDFWLSDTPEVPSIDWGNACVRMCTWARLVDRVSGRHVYVYNTHLDHVSQPSREKGARLILERIRGRAHPDPVILTGDFNAGEDNSAIGILRTAPGSGGQGFLLLDTFRVLHPDATAVGTFNGFTGRADGPKIDYVFVSAGVEVLAAEILRTHRDGAYPSDHFPVTARIRLPPVAGEDGTR